MLLKNSSNVRPSSRCTEFKNDNVPSEKVAALYPPPEKVKPMFKSLAIATIIFFTKVIYSIDISKNPS